MVENLRKLHILVAYTVVLLSVFQRSLCRQRFIWQIVCFIEVLLTNRVSGRWNALCRPQSSPPFTMQLQSLRGKSNISIGFLVWHTKCAFVLPWEQDRLRHIIWLWSTLWHPSGLAENSNNNGLADQILTQFWLISRLW